MVYFDFHQIPAYWSAKIIFFAPEWGCCPFFSAKNEIFALLDVGESQQK